MQNRNHQAGLTMLELLMILVVLMVIGATLGGLAIEYVVEFWASYAKKTPVDVPFTPCMILGVFFGWNLGPIAAAITWILSVILL